MFRLLAVLLILPISALADSDVTVSNGKRCITSDGLPDHATGNFPRRGNPNKISRQNIRFCVDATPEYSDRSQNVPTIGIALNGIIIRPGTADWYDASSPRKHSRDKSSGWRLDGLGAASQLGMDQNNAHVDNRGLYHYHGIAEPLTELSDSSLIGWAADGFEIHYIGDDARSSYQLKSGIRPTAPGGRYDGTYVQDWDFIEGSGNLDDCNGAMIDGIYAYFATDTFPFYPHCLKGKNITRYR